MRKVFVSHHHDDAVALAEHLKPKLKKGGYICFLAHADIKPGEHDLQRIEKEIKECDVFLYVGGEAANLSVYCQQEIGIAIGSAKQIITSSPKNSPLPTGFVARIQTITFDNIDAVFANHIYKSLFSPFQPNEKDIQNLKYLAVNGFSLTEAKDKIYLNPILDWNDFGYETVFLIHINGKHVGKVKIGYLGQDSGTHTSEAMSTEFKCLKIPFFSRLMLNDEGETALKTKRKKILLELLNDISTLTEEDLAQASEEPVYKKSLLR